MPALQASQYTDAQAFGGVSPLVGPRIHPVYGDRRMHNGVDYGAPAAPIYAAGNGVLTFVEPERRLWQVHQH